MSRIAPSELLEKIRKACDDESQRRDETSFWTSGVAYGEITVFQSTDKTYTLQPTTEALQHIQSDNALCQRFLTIRTSISDEVFSIRSPRRKEGNYKRRDSPVACVFVALGWLAEKQDKTKMTTYYVVLLNLSTQPASVWLMYDYHIKSFEEDIVEWTNELGEYRNMLFTHDDDEEGRDLAQDDLGWNNANGIQDGCDRNDNLRALYINMDKTSVPKPRKEQTKLTDKASIKKTSISGSSHAKSAEPSKSLSSGPTTVSNASRNSEAKGTVLNSSKLHGPESNDHSKGYLGLPLFDLALLAPDINEWSEKGMDLELVKKCLRSSYMHIGPEWRVQEAKQEQLKVIQDKKNRIDLRELGW